MQWILFDYDIKKDLYIFRYRSAVRRCGVNVRRLCPDGHDHCRRSYGFARGWPSLVQPSRQRGTGERVRGQGSVYQQQPPVFCLDSPLQETTDHGDVQRRVYLQYDPGKTRRPRRSYLFSNQVWIISYLLLHKLQPSLADDKVIFVANQNEKSNIFWMTNSFWLSQYP